MEQVCVITWEVIEDMNEEQKKVIDWYLKYQRQHRTTGSGRAMASAITAIIGTGVCHPVVIGALDLENIDKFLSVIGDKEVLRAIANVVHWGREPY